VGGAFRQARGKPNRKAHRWAIFIALKFLKNGVILKIGEFIFTCQKDFIKNHKTK